MDKAYNIFLFLIVFGLILTFLPRIGDYLGYRDENSPSILSRILGTGEVLISFDGGRTFEEANKFKLDRIFRDTSGNLFAVEDDNIYKSVDGGRSWIALQKADLGSRSVLEVERDGRIILLESRN